MLKSIWDRVANEPVLVTAVILAAGNLIGEDFSGVASSVESAIVVIAGIITRHFVSPVRSL